MTFGSIGSTSQQQQAYGESSYWDKRYSQETGPFDWYQKYHSLSPLLRLYISTHHRLLVVGCGNSAFSEDMVNDGYQDVVNSDISSVVIEAMQKKYIHLPQMNYMKMDVRDMNEFQGGFFDAVIDKGTLDSILCGHNSRENAFKMLGEIERVLKEEGVYILITYGAPSHRLHLLRDSGSWTIRLHVIDKLLTDKSSGSRQWDLTSPIPLDDGGRSVDSVLGKNPEIHYIYVCIKGGFSVSF